MQIDLETLQFHTATTVTMIFILTLFEPITSWHSIFIFCKPEKEIKLRVNQSYTNVNIIGCNKELVTSP